MTFTITLDCQPLSGYNAKLNDELVKLRIESQKRYLIGRARQKQLKDRLLVLQSRYAATFV